MTLSLRLLLRLRLSLRLLLRLNLRLLLRLNLTTCRWVVLVVGTPCWQQ